MVKFSVYRGDITKLKVESIVNASNESGLGCTIPNHCIDSAIHLAAGPELLEECKLLKGIPTGIAKITKGYKLPCKYIIHVTGPKINSEGKCDFNMLSASYIACLEIARTHKIKEIAFCCISTGIFGFPKLESSEIAIKTIVKWLKDRDHSIESIIFDVFTYEDHSIYQTILSSYKIEFDTSSFS